MRRTGLAISTVGLEAWLTCGAVTIDGITLDTVDAWLTLGSVAIEAKGVVGAR